jgi:hypothetical protein
MPPRRDYFAFLTAASGFQHKGPEFLARRPEVAELTDRRCDRLSIKRFLKHLLQEAADADADTECAA